MILKKFNNSPHAVFLKIGSSEFIFNYNICIAGYTNSLGNFKRKKINWMESNHQLANSYLKRHRKKFLKLDGEVVDELLNNFYLIENK